MVFPNCTHLELVASWCLGTLYLIQFLKFWYIFLKPLNNILLECQWTFKKGIKFNVHSYTLVLFPRKELPPACNSSTEETQGKLHLVITSHVLAKYFFWADSEELIYLQWHVCIYANILEEVCKQDKKNLPGHVYEIIITNYFSKNRS